MKSLHEYVKPAIYKKLNKLGIRSFDNILLHLPFRYEDETKVVLLKDVVTDTFVQVVCNVIDCRVVYRPSRQLIVTIEDSTGNATVRLFNFYQSQYLAIKNANLLKISGNVKKSLIGLEFLHPKYKIIKQKSDLVLPKTLTPIYPTTAGLKQLTIKRLIRESLTKIDLTETVSENFLVKEKFISFEKAINSIHNPLPNQKLDFYQDRSNKFWKKIKFDELLAQQLFLKLHREKNNKLIAPSLKISEDKYLKLSDSIGLDLTKAQTRVIGEIREDLKLKRPMQRLLQGDVGSGKTLVAAFAVVHALESGYQTAIMAPTEILAEQHLIKFRSWLKTFNVDVCWLGGNLKKKERELVYKKLENGEEKVVVGTHALFQERVKFKNIGLILIDEQHRFGVSQRHALKLKGVLKNNFFPHQLMISATPIPRTLAMSYFSDLDVSTLDELPKGRIPIKTKLISQNRRLEIEKFVKQVCINGEQVYWVCPLIDQLSDDKEKDTSVSVKRIFKKLVENLPDIPIALIHGKLKTEEKKEIMNNFKLNKYSILVSTTVIEVGVDVPNATVMIIEDANKMGLSQLHQLRGRVGRGKKKSTCILLYKRGISEIGKERLRIIYENNDGFDLAKKDLELRGPGELLGERQSGVPSLRFANLQKDIDLLEKARTLSQEMIKRDTNNVIKHLKRWISIDVKEIKI